MSVPSGCAEAVSRLWEYLEGGLAPADFTAVERHLFHCLRCCGEVVFARELQHRLAGDPPSIPRDVEDRLEQFLDAVEPLAGESP